MLVLALSTLGRIFVDTATTLGLTGFCVLAVAWTKRASVEE